jgi:exosortase
MLKSAAVAPPGSTGPIAPDTMTKSPSTGEQATVSPAAWWATAVLIVLLAVMYYSVAAKLVSDWWNIPDYSHGLLIPFFVAFLIWDKRAAFRATPLAPSWAGISLIIPALFILLVGVFGADLFLARTSFVLLVAGLIWLLLGKPMLGESRFLLFVFLLGIPLPVLIMNHITFPLQLMASQLASSLLPLAGVPVLREGNVISLPAMQLEVAEACSGIRSLMSLFTVAVIFCYFMEPSNGRRTILALASIPIAVAANAARIFGTGLCVQYWDPVKAMGFFHEFSGWLMFVVSLSCLYLVHSVMRMVKAKGEVSA